MTACGDKRDIQAQPCILWMPASMTASPPPGGCGMTDARHLWQDALATSFKQL